MVDVKDLGLEIDDYIIGRGRCQESIPFKRTCLLPVDLKFKCFAEGLTKGLQVVLPPCLMISEVV